MTRCCGLILACALAAAAARDELRAAREAESRGDLAAAERSYEKALAAREDPDILLRLGLVRHLRNHFGDAIAPLERAVRLKPELWAAHLFLGIDLYRTNQFARAVPHLEKTLELQPRQSEARFWLGAARLALKDYLPGFLILEELLRDEPRNLELLRLLAQNYSDQATALHNQVASEHPQSPWAQLVHAHALESDGFPDAALDHYRAALALNPDLREAREAIQRLTRAASK